MSLATLADHQDVWETIQARRLDRELQRLAPPLVRLWDGDYTYRGTVAGERAGSFEFVENETGTASIELPLDNYLAKWVMNHKGRDKRNVHITIDKQGSRWSGCMDHYRVVRTKLGDAYVELIFKHDYEQAKHILVWSNPFLRAELQFPKMWIIFGPAKFCLMTTLFCQLLRLETSLWTLPDNPLDINEWMGPSFNPATWRNIVKPFPILSDNSNLTIVFSRFKSFHEVAKRTLEDAQLTLTCRRYLVGEDPHPFQDLSGELNVDVIEDLFSMIPLRHGCLVWDIIDNSEWGTETAFGGSLLTGLIRAVVTIGGDGVTEGVDVFTGDPTFPGEYYVPWFLGTSPQAPWVVFEEGQYTGINSSEFLYYEATDTSVVTGGASAPGVNEGISAAINIGGDILTSFINSQLATLGAVGGAIDLPPLGGMMDAVAKILYEDVILAFMETPTLRAAGLTMPITGLENLVTGVGDFHYFEGWADGADRAFTISALLAVRAKLWDTRAHTAHTISVSDAAPYYIGEKPYGHFWLGSRVGTTVLGYPDPHTIFVERVGRIKYKWGKDGPSGWDLSIGYREPADPLQKTFKMIQDINGTLSQLGVW
jgi:hypothetical protein